jgi:uncharacterized MAPEG superfamily protein
MPHRRSLIRLAVIINGGFALATLLAIRALAPAFPAPARVASEAERLVYALHLLVAPTLVLVVLVLATVTARALAGALNPLDDPESRLYRKNQRALTNTVEQTVIFVPAFLALATLLPAVALGGLSLAAGLFVTGRLLFWIGYLIHPLARAPGMAVTLTVNILVVGIDLWLLR